MQVDDANIESMSITQRLNRLGYTTERVEQNGRLRGMRILKDGICIHPGTPIFHVDNAESLCISLGG